MTTRRSFSLKTKADIIARQDGKCACPCGEKFTDPRDVHFDHIVPLWLGGEDTPDNLQALLPRHHIDKTTREAKDRAKVNRIRKQDGLRKRKLNAREKALAKMTGMEI